MIQKEIKKLDSIPIKKGQDLEQLKIILADIITNDKFGCKLTKAQVENKIKELLTVNVSKVDVDILQVIHWIVCKDDEDFMYYFKKGPNEFGINNKKIYCDNHLVIDKQINSILNDFTSKPFSLYRLFSLDSALIYTHPFNNGNSRTIKVLLNLLLHYHNYLPIAFPKLIFSYLFRFQDKIDTKITNQHHFLTYCLLNIYIQTYKIDNH